PTPPALHTPRSSGGEWREYSSRASRGQALLGVTVVSMGAVNAPRLLCGHIRSLAIGAVRHESGWNNATVFPSGSLNHADFPIPAVVATWSTVLTTGKSSSSTVPPRATRSRTSASTSLVQKRTWVWSALFGDGRP